MARGQYVDLSHRLSVAEYARQWAASRPHRPTTARRTAGLIDNHIAATRLGGRRLAEVKPSEAQGRASDRARLLGPATTRSLVGLLRSIYAAAALDRLVPFSPVVRITLPRVERPRIVPLSVEHHAGPFRLHRSSWLRSPSTSRAIQRGRTGQSSPRRQARPWATRTTDTSCSEGRWTQRVCPRGRRATAYGITSPRCCWRPASPWSRPPSGWGTRTHRSC